MVLSPFVSHPMSPFVFPFCWLARRVRRPGTLSPLFPRCLVPTCVSVLDVASAFLTSCLPLSPHMCVCVGWCVRLPDVLSHPLSPHMCACVGWCLRLPVVSHSLPLSPRMCAPVLVGWCVRLPDVLFPNWLPLSLHVCLCWDGVSAFPTSCFRIVSHCPHMCACVGWCVRLPEVLSPLVSLLVYPCLRLSPRVSHCLPLSPVASNCLPTCACVGWSTFPKSWFSLPPIFSLDMCDLCCMVRPLSRGLVSPLSPIVSLLVSLCWMVCPPSFVSFVSQLVFLLVSQLVSQLVFLLVSLCGGWSDFAFFQTVYCWGRLS